MGLRYQFESFQSMFSIGSSWNAQRWIALYVFSDSIASNYGIGVYLAHYQGASQIKEKIITTPIDYTEAALAPADYKIYYGGDQAGANEINLIRRV